MDVDIQASRVQVSDSQHWCPIKEDRQTERSVDIQSSAEQEQDLRQETRTEWVAAEAVSRGPEQIEDGRHLLRRLVYDDIHESTLKCVPRHRCCKASLRALFINEEHHSQEHHRHWLHRQLDDLYLYPFKCITASNDHKDTWVCWPEDNYATAKFLPHIMIIFNTHFLWIL